MQFFNNNPADGIENAEADNPEPDPLTLAEIDLVLGWMLQRYPEPVLNYFEFAFFSGMRPSEIIALQWGDVDWTSETIDATG